jgi:2-polyprenyl-6-methoxyphenol hydroxylase-like FAD-dependent oxidoreductase
MGHPFPFCGNVAIGAEDPRRGQRRSVVKVVIAGAGIGGLFTALRLRRAGIDVEVYEQGSRIHELGVGINLLPHAVTELAEVGLLDRLDEIGIRTHELSYTHRLGPEIMRRPCGLSAGFAVPQFSIHRGRLQSMLYEAVLERLGPDAVRTGHRLVGFDQSEKEVHADFADRHGVVRARASGDVLVGADGIHSTVRRKLFGEVSDHDTGWGCWVWIVRGTTRPATAVREHWGAGRFLGTYPIKGGLGVVAAAPSRLMGPEAVGRDGRKVKSHFAALGAGVADLLAALPDDLGDTFWWKLSDARSKDWIKGRVALLGDAACAFLPTAGVGASMALESAAVLDDELGRTDARFLPGALARYEMRRKPRAETFQEDSRRLASMMMIESTELSWGRDQLMKFYTLDMLAKNIAQSLAKPI